MRTWTAVLAFLASLASIAPAFAQVFPSRPITVVVPFAAGGPTDVIARTLGQHMRTSLGQPIIVENTAGANGNVGVGKVARAAPDGYTISIGHWSTHVVNGAVYTLPYDVLKDFEPVSLIATNSYLIVAKNAVPANDLKSFIAWLKANPDKALEGTAGSGSPQHVGHALWVPKGTPKDVVTKLNAAVVSALSDQAVRSRLTDLGQEIFAREQLAPAALAAYHKAEVDKWWPIIKAAGIKAE